jgi:hypothetical protein
VRFVCLSGFLFCLTLSAQTPDISLVAYYPFDGNANDHSLNNNNGTVNGATLTTGRFGHLNSAYHFDGAASFIDIGNDPTLKMDLEVTIATWINIDLPLTGGSGFYNVISDHSPTYNNGKIFRFQANNLEFLLGPEGSLEANYTFPDSASGWHHIANTYDGDSIIIFVDGVNVASALRQGIINVNPNALLIGKSGWGEYFKGDMDDFRIYNRALSENEIKGLMAIFKDSFED